MTNIIPQNELDTYQGELDTAEKFVLSLEVKNEDDYRSALAKGKSIKVQLDAIIKRKEYITKPQYAAYKSAMDFFKPFEVSLKGTLDIIKAKMTAYTDEKERKAALAIEKIEARVERGTLSEAQGNVKKFVAEIPKTVSTVAGSATTKKVAKYYVVDKSQVPLDFLEVDLSKVKASFASGFPVPGCEMRMESQLSIR